MTSDDTMKLCEALLAFHDLVEPVPKNSSSTAGQGRTYKYSDLAAVWATIRGPLCSTGLAVYQMFEPTSAEITIERTSYKGEVTRSQALAVLRTRLVHQSGQWVESVLPVVAEWSDPQRLGGVITYLRRYSLLALLGLACEDDDGASAVPRERTTHQRNGSNGQRPAETFEAAALMEPTAPRPAKRPPPRTGKELADYCRTCRIDPDLGRWLETEFPRYPHRKEEWTEFQVMTARPVIRTHLETMRDARNGAIQ